MTSPLRVALFTDCFHETNGVATLCREYVAYARQQGIPFFCAYGGPETTFNKIDGLHEYQLRRGPLSFGVDADVICDPFLSRYRDRVVSKLREFRPDLVHITGPGDVSILGLWAANLVGVPTVASWHTNLHEYTHRRLEKSLAFLPRVVRERVSRGAGDGTLWAVQSYYKIAHFVAAPNQDMVDLLVRKTGRPAFLMEHGVNTDLFIPARRTRSDSQFCIGYVGRLTPEKNVRALVEMERSLLASGESNFCIMVVGDGSEREWLRANLKTAIFAGVLQGEKLATAFANMDAFVFPSLTDTFGLVILEAMCSGVPVIVHPEAGIRAGVLDGITGLHSNDFAASILHLIRCGESRDRIGAAARIHARSKAWFGVFEDLHRIYRDGLRSEQTLRRMPTPQFGPPH